jgi:hypothetical protein
MPTETAQKLLQEEINRFNLEIPAAVFQFGFDRNTAEEYLRLHPDVPFILRVSRFDEYFALDIPSQDRNIIRHLLVSSPKSDEKEFKLSTYDNSGFNEFSSLREYFEILWDPEHKRMRSVIELAELKGKQAWEQFKLRQQPNQEHKIAVLSIQSLDKKKIALTPEEIHTYSQQNAGLKHAGDGHTGFAMAMALNAPFVVVRSKENREESNGKLQDHVGDNGLIVVTGHGRPGGDGIKGTYINVGEIEEIDLYNKQVERGPGDIVSTVMDAGLKSGNHITIVLSICFGALDTSSGAGDSFALKLAREFATQGISSTIIASDKPVLRFGTNAIIDEKITFNNRVGMAAEDVYVFTTEVDGPNSNPKTSIYKPNETVQLTKNGVEFLNPNKPQMSLADNQKILEEEQRLQKLAEEEQRLQKQVEEEQRLQKQVEEEQRLQKQVEEEQRLQKQVEEEQRLQKQAEEEPRLQRQAEEEPRLQKQAEEEQRLQKQVEEEQRLQKQTPERKNADFGTLTPEEQRFNLLLKNLLIKGETLKKRCDQVNPVHNKLEHKNLNDAYNAVLKLEKALKAEGTKYFTNPSENSYFKFKAGCDRHIKSARNILDQHRGWSEFLINLAIGIFTLGIGLLVKAGVNLAINKPFFFVHNTDSAQKLNEIDDFVNEIKPKS